MGSHKQTPEAEELGRAIALAAKAHAGQTDRAGAPYIFHPLRVMMACSDHHERLAAVLHDVVEDTSVTLAQLLAEGFPPSVVEAVDALSRRDGEAYFDFIERAKSNQTARAVKKQDLWDNYLNPARRRSLRPDLEERYSRAWVLLA